MDFGGLKVNCFPHAVVLISSVQYANEDDILSKTEETKLFSIDTFAKKSLNVIVSFWMHCSIVMLIFSQCSYKSNSCQTILCSIDFQPNLFWVAWRVTAGASIPVVSSSDLTIMVSFLWYWLKDGMPKKPRKRLKRRSWRIVFETRTRLSFMLLTLWSKIDCKEFKQPCLELTITKWNLLLQVHLWI